MTVRLGGVAAALLLIAGSAVAAEDDAMSGRINHGSEEIAKAPGSTSGSMPNSIDDPARDDAASTQSSAVNSGAVSEGPQNPRIGAAPPNAPPGASPQTMPSTLSPQNAAEDRRSWMQRVLPLSDEEKQALRTSILRGEDAAAAPSEPGVAQAKIGNVLPSSVAMHELPADAAQRVPQARSFKYVRAGDRVLIVDPASWAVVGIL